MLFIILAVFIGGLLFGAILEKHSVAKKRGLKNVDFLLNDWKYSYECRTRRAS